ncbi:MAG: PorV/PorQ family protein, partial [Candidatus Zixiibacteriota bacterium]
MTTFRKYFFATLVVLAIVGSAKAADGNGGYAGSFLQVPIGARPSGMGGAYLGLSDDGAGPLFNPAGTANLNGRLFTTSYRLLGLDRTLAYASIIFPTKGNSVVGVNWLYAGSGSVEARNSFGQPLGHELSMNTHDFGVLFAKRFEDVFSAGLKINYYHADFAEINAGSVGLDFGLMFYLDMLFDRQRRDLMAVRDIQIGATVKNVGSRFIWNNGDYLFRYQGPNAAASEQQDDIPVEFGLGASAKFFQQKLTLAADLLKDTKTDANFHAGAEYLHLKKFAVRSGISDGSFTAGGGYLFKLGNQTLAI